MNIEKEEKLSIFEKAFSLRGGGIRRTCDCGKEYYEIDSTYHLEEGELEELEKNNAIGLDYNIYDIEFEGRQFVDSCDCWHDRALQIMSFLDGHRHNIVDYFKMEKERRQKQVNLMADV